MNKTIELQSVIKCPECDFEKPEEMPTNACQYFYKCSACDSRLKPVQGDCCVFCSYGSIKCPPQQLENRCYKEK